MLVSGWTVGSTFTFDGSNKGSEHWRKVMNDSNAEGRLLLLKPRNSHSVCIERIQKLIRWRCKSRVLKHCYSTNRGLPAKTAYLPNLDFFSFWYQSSLHVIIFNLLLFFCDQDQFLGRYRWKIKQFIWLIENNNNRLSYLLWAPHGGVKTEWDITNTTLCCLVMIGFLVPHLL